MKKGRQLNLWLVRHGESKAQTGEQFSFDPDLSAAGRRQARRLRGPLSKVRFDRIYVSPLRRARQTLELSGLVKAAGRRAVRFDSRILELDRDRYASLLPYPEPPDYGVPDAHDAWGADPMERLASFLDEMRAVSGKASNVLVVSHAMALSVLLNMFFCGSGKIAEAEAMSRFCRVSNASISVLRLGGPCESLLAWNCRRHLEGLPGFDKGEVITV